jgi:hypothetical protein
MNLRNFSFLATTLCVFSFLFAPVAAQAEETRVIGKLYIQEKGKILLNDKSAKSGADVRNGSKVQTFAFPAKVFLVRGGTVYIKAYSRVRIFDFEDEPIRLDIVYGGGEVRLLDNRRPDQWPAGWIGSETADGATGLEPLPYLAAFGFGNFSFPSIGGGGSSGSGTSGSGTTPASNPPVTPVTP